MIAVEQMIGQPASVVVAAERGGGSPATQRLEMAVFA